MTSKAGSCGRDLTENIDNFNPIYDFFSLLQGPNFCISHEDFVRFALPFLNDQDLVLLIYTHSGKREKERKKVT